jgi:hypothetical protein
MSQDSFELLAQQFASLNEQLRRDSGAESVFQSLVQMATRAVPGCSWAGVTVWEKTGPRGLASTDPVAAEVDDLQHRLNEGPCVTAAVDDAPVLLDDMERDGRWPTLVQEVLARTPVRTVLSFTLGRSPRSALNLYGDRAFAFDAVAVGAGALFASHAQAFMSHKGSLDRAQQLDRALVSSRSIGTAIGVVMATHKVSEERAFELLSEASQRLNRKLRELALDVSHTGELPG